MVVRPHSPALRKIFLHLLVDEGSLVHEEHIDIIDVVVMVAEHGWQFGHRSRVVVLGIIGSVLDLVHQRVRLSD